MHSTIPAGALGLVSTTSEIDFISAIEKLAKA